MPLLVLEGIKMLDLICNQAEHMTMLLIVVELNVALEGSYIAVCILDEEVLLLLNEDRDS